MNDTILRSKLIRLASEHPEFRKDILPLLKTGMEFDTPEEGPLKREGAKKPNFEKALLYLAKGKTLFEKSSDLIAKGAAIAQLDLGRGYGADWDAAYGEYGRWLNLMIHRFERGDNS